MPYRCKDCRRHFGVRTRTAMSGSPIPLNKWLHALYLWHACDGVVARRLGQELGISYKAALSVSRRIRQAVSFRSVPGIRGS